MRVYVAGPLADTAAVREVQTRIGEAGHELTLDWTADTSFVEDYASRPEESAEIARADLDAVLRADAVVIVASGVVVGPIRHESAFYFHPAVRRVTEVDEWLTSIG